ncbi:MAG TPA: condensation domain-containing protein [Acetobacteraceae bacterium]|nr:condensation domain-containing protein [Acetobacteraceae bacterium]
MTAAIAPAVHIQEEPLGGAAAEFPCTVGQLKTWRLDRAHPGDPTLNIAARWRLEGRVIPALLERSLAMLIDRHEPLRTGFAERAGVLVQRVMPRVAMRLRVIDLTAMPEAERADKAVALAREEARQSFDVTRPPLLRAVLVLLEPAAADLLVTTHYMVGDCWSNGILARETADIYDALRANRLPRLDELDLQFGDYARWQEAWLKEGGADAAEAYWRRQLANLPDFHVPTDRALPARPAKAGDILGMPVPSALVEAAQEMARERGATFFMLGVAALAILLHRWTGAGEVVFGTQVAGRDEVELESLIGPFVNTVSLRISLAGDPSVAALLDRVRHAVGEALEHAAAPIERVAQALPRAQSAERRRDPLTAVNFLIQRAFTRDAAHGDFALKGVPNFSPGSRYDVNVFLVERPGGWRASCEYDPELFDRARIDWLLRSFLAVLGAAAADPARHISSLALLPDRSEDDRQASRPAVSYASIPQLRMVSNSDNGEAPQIETQLAAIWAKVLRLNAVPPNANFFELGGNSLRAAHLLALTRQTFGRTVSLGQMFKAPTLDAMAALLRGDADAPPAGVVVVQPNGSQPPIFAINNTGVFYTLSRHLGADQPFIAVQALDPDVSPSLHPADFRVIAARYAETIQQVRPHGPYVLIGLCAAGKVALEVAQQLMAAGEDVRLLAVVDTWAPGHMRRLKPMRRLLARANLRAVRLRRQLQRIREGTLSVYGFIANRAAVRGVRNATFELLRRKGVLPSLPPGVQNNLFVKYLDRAASAYEPSPYAGRVLVLHGPEQPRGRFLDPSFGWTGLVAGPVDVVAVPTDPHTRFEDHHQGLFQDPGAQVMAQAIVSALR